MDDINYKRIKQKSLRSGILSLLGILIFVSSLIYASVNLNKSEKIIQKQKIEVDSLILIKIAIADSVIELRTQLENTRRATRFITMGINHYHAKNYLSAVEAYSFAIELDSLNPVVYDYKGYSLYKNHKYDQAIECFDIAVKIDPHYAWGYYDLSLAQWAKGLKSEAVETIEFLIAMEPEFISIIINDGQFKYIREHPKIKEALNN